MFNYRYGSEYRYQGAVRARKVQGHEKRKGHDTPKIVHIILKKTVSRYIGSAKILI